jgi:hypothetical protein
VNGAGEFNGQSTPMQRDSADGRGRMHATMRAGKSKE